MKLSFIIILLFCVYHVLSDTSFIPKGQRAEIFELTDNEVPVFRITLPNEEFKTLKKKAIPVSSGVIDDFNNAIKKIVTVINDQNFFEIFPGVNFKEILPELPIKENGHPNINFEKYIINSNNNFDKIFECPSTSRCIFKILNDDSYINLIKVFHTISNLDISSEVDNNFNILIDEFGKKVRINDEGKFYFPDDSSHNEENPEKELADINDYFGYNFNYDETSTFNDSPEISEWPSVNEDYDDGSSSTYSSSSKFWNFINNYLFNLSKYGNNNNNEEKTDFVDQFQNDPDNNNDDDITPSFDTSDYYYPNFNDYTPKQFEDLFKNYDFDKIDDDFSNITDEFNFKTKNATLIVEINNEKKEFDKVTFSIAGSFSRFFAKLGYNLKIRGKKDLYGRRQFKLRGDSMDSTYMRTKLVSDIHNRMGMPSLSANYATLYINDEYMGLFIFTDIFKESWIEYVYGEKDTSLLYKCNDCDLTYDTRHGFENENKEATNKRELYEFLSKMTTAKSASDVESIFDLDQFYKEIAITFLTCSWDHSGHNYYIYKHNDKWIYFTHDFDFDMGYYVPPSMHIDSYKGNIIIKKLILNDDRRFNEILKEIVEKAFNPAILFPHIDELKSFIRPYVKLDKTPDEQGQYPGRINKSGTEFYSLQQWEDTTEFKNFASNNYALKKFILIRYRIICKDYNLECDPIYIDRHYGMTNNTTLNEPSDKKDNIQTEIETAPENVTPTPTETTLKSTSAVQTTSSPTDNNTNAAVNDITNDNSNNSVECLAEFIGYPCCPSRLTTVYAQDEYGDWGYDFSKNEWCGLTKYENSSSNENECWSEPLGYPCCSGCKVYEKDSDGEWGYELNHWCGILSSRCKKMN